MHIAPELVGTIMAKTTTPLMSTEAHGKLNDILTYRAGTSSTTVMKTWKQPYKTTPAARRIRAGFQLGSQWYASRKSQVDALWSEQAEKDNLPIRETWLRAFMNTWVQGKILRENGTVNNGPISVSLWNTSTVVKQRGIEWRWNTAATGTVVAYFIVIREGNTVPITNEFVAVATGLQRSFLQTWGTPGAQYTFRPMCLNTSGVWRNGGIRQATFPS
jgi:hypothetical protein